MSSLEFPRSDKGYEMCGMFTQTSNGLDTKRAGTDCRTKKFVWSQTNIFFFLLTIQSFPFKLSRWSRSIQMES